MGFLSKKEADVEAAPISSTYVGDMKLDTGSSRDYVPDDGAVHAETFVIGDRYV
jgi:hypothetical protein